MPIKRDINSKEDIIILVDEFYRRVRKDVQLGFIFSENPQFTWEKHLPKMYDFFENIIFYSGEYTGNPMEYHQQLNKLLPLTPLHFKQWGILFTATVDDLFSGERSFLLKRRALNIALIMQNKFTS